MTQVPRTPGDLAELAPFQRLLDAGAPAWEVRDQVERYLEGLSRLPQTVSDVDAAIERATAFLRRMSA